MNELKAFFREEDGMGTVEIVLIIAALVAVALIFRKAIIGFVGNATKSVFGGASSGLSTNP